MQYEKKTNVSAILNLEVLISFVIVIGMLYDFRHRIFGYFGMSDVTGISRFAYFMLAMTFMAVLIQFVFGFIMNKGGAFIWLAILYVVFAFISTAISGRYPFERLPFRFVEMFYWVAVMLLSYYAALSLNTPKFHVAIVVLALPYLSYCFYLSRRSEVTSADFLLLNPVYFISFLMPVVFLLKSKILKVAGLLLIFAVVLLSYKRMALIAYLMSIAAYFYLRIFAGSHVKFWKIIAGFIGGCLFLGLLAFAFQYVAGAFGLDWGGRMSDLVTSGGSGRIDIWRRALSAMASQPGYLLLGHGYKALSEDIRWAHNDVIEILYDFGIIGLAFYFIFLGKMAQIFFKMKQFGYQHVGAFAVSLIWFFWGAMTDVFINYPYWVLGIAMFWGITVADFENAQKQACLAEMDDALYDDQHNGESAEQAPYAYYL